MRWTARLIGGGAILTVILVFASGSIPAGAAVLRHEVGPTFGIGAIATRPEITAARTAPRDFSSAQSSTHPLVTITGPLFRFRPSTVSASQIPYGSPCDGSNYSFALSNRSAQTQTVTVDGQQLVTLRSGANTIICGTSVNDTTFTAAFGLVSTPHAHLTATFVVAQVTQPTVRITGAGPNFSPQSLSAPEIPDGSPCDPSNYSFLLSNTTSSNQTVSIDGQVSFTESPGTSAVICGTGPGESPFTATFGLTSNPGAMLTVQFD